MIQVGQKPVRKFCVPTPSRQRQLTESENRRFAKAGWLRRIAQLIGENRGTLKEKQDLVRMTIIGGLIPPGPVPSIETIRRLESRWKAGEHDIEDYLPDRRPGRPRAPIPGPIDAMIRNSIEKGDGHTAARLQNDAEKLAHSLGMPAPSYYLVKRRVAEIGRLVRSAAQHGNRAAVIDGCPHGRVPATRSHSVMALDEVTYPVYTSIQNLLTGLWHSVLMDAVLGIDLASSAIVTYQLVDPKLRLNDDGSPKEHGTDLLHVMGALLSLASPDLAPPATQEFAGYIPPRIRLDNLMPHKSLEAWVKEVELGIDVYRIPKYSAYRNGAAERRVSILKDLSRGMLGHVDAYLPTDRITATKADVEYQQLRAAGGTARRQPSLQLIRPEDLLRPHEILNHIDRQVRDYNYERINRRTGETPAVRFRDRMTRGMRRSGADLIRALSANTKLVTSDGIEHTADGRTYVFYPKVGGMTYSIDTPVTYRFDPLGRGLWVELNGRLEFIRPSTHLDKDDGAAIARDHNHLAGLAHRRAEALRNAALSERIGAENVALAEAEYQEVVQRLKAGEQDHLTNLKDRDTGSPHGEADGRPRGPSFPNPWAQASPETFLRRRSDPFPGEEE